LRAFANRHGGADASLGQQRGDGFGGILERAFGIHHDVDAIREARISQQLFRQLGVVTIAGQFAGAKGIGRKDAIDGCRVAAEDLVDQKVLVDRVGRGLPHQRIIEVFAFEVHRYKEAAGAVHGHHMGAVIGIDLCDREGRQFVDNVHVARKQGRDTAGAFGDDLEDHPVNAGWTDRRNVGSAAVVICEALQNDRFTLAPLHQLERPGAVFGRCDAGRAICLDKSL